MAQEQLQIIINSQAKGKGAQDSRKELDGLTRTVKFVATAFATLKAAQGALDFVEFGAGVKRQAAALDGLAKSAGTSGDAITQAIQGASDFTIDRMTAMSAASKAMILDVAETPAQFERLTKVATALGRAMGQDAAKSIDDFVVAAGRQSRMIADNLGLMVSAGTAQEHYAQKLGKTVGELTEAEQKQAFLNEMLVQGEAKMAALGNTTGDAAGEIEKLKAAVSDAKADFAEIAVEYVIAGGNADDLAAKVRGLATTWRQASLIGRAAAAGLAKAFSGEGGRGAQTLFVEGWTEAWKDHLGVVDNVVTGYNGYRAVVEETTWEMKDLDEETLAYLESLGETEQELGKYGNTASGIGEVIEELARKHDEAAYRMAQATFNMSIAFSDFYRRGREQAADFAEQREQIEADHQERLADVLAKGQARAIQIDAEAEEEKLANLKQKLAIALQQQAEFTDKTKESTRMSKDAQIADLQAQIGEQEQLLSDFYGGRLIQQGQNISAELTAEQTRYDEELAMLEASRAEQEEEYRRSWGQILLQWFDGWAQMNQISSEKAMEMRIAIAEEYGLLDEAGARTMESLVAGWQAYADGSVESADVVIKQAEAVKAAVENLPTHKTITIEARVDEIIRRGGGWQEQFPGEEVAGPTPQESAVPREGETTPTTPGTRPRTPTPEAPSSPFEMQHGGYVRYGGLYGVGEAGREMVALPGGSYVFNATETAQMLNRAIGGRRALPAMAGGALGGGNFSQVIHQTFIINGFDKSPRELAAEIKREERMSGGRIQV